MARGWESKSVESQIEDASMGVERRGVFTPEERELKHKRDSLELSRKRVLHDLEAARSPVRRSSLEQALAFLDEELRQLADVANVAGIAR
jgi:hypothetical protein